MGANSESRSAGMSLLIGDDDMRVLIRLSALFGISRSEVLRRALSDYAAWYPPMPIHLPTDRTRLVNHLVEAMHDPCGDELALATAAIDLVLNVPVTSRKHVAQILGDLSTTADTLRADKSGRIVLPINLDDAPEE